MEFCLKDVNLVVKVAVKGLILIRISKLHVFCVGGEIIVLPEVSSGNG